MVIQKENIDHIKDAFSKMKSKEDLLILLNYCKLLIYGDKTVPFEIKHINYHSNPKANSKRYTQFSITKKSGAQRTIHAPNKGLKAIQKCLNLIFQTIYEVNPSANGFVPGRSIVDNAKVHVGSFYVYNIDLKDFFPSIDQARIWGRLKYPPFNLNEKNDNLELANIISALCCHEMIVERLDENNEWQKVSKKVLPQGAPTSPTLTNIICQKLDFYLNAVAKRFGLRYSRYADDITFSSMYNVFQKESDFQKELYRILAEQNFTIKESKTRLQKQGYRQEVTGLLVNDNVNVQKHYIKQLRMWLYYWEQYGYNRANSYFIQQYIKDKGITLKGYPNMANVISGKLDYLKMVKGIENQLYLDLKKRFDYLTGKNEASMLTSPIGKVEIIKTELLSSITNKTNQTLPDASIENKLRININPLSVTKKSSKLNRQIIINRGQSLPFEGLVDNVEKQEKEIDLSKHKPIDVTRFLMNFRASEGLKFLTHDYDKANSLFEYEDVLKIAKKEFDDLSSQFVIPISLGARINQFAFGDPNKSWWFNKDRFKLNWKSPELISWMKMNPNTHPIKNEEFERGFIAPFKKSIEIKAPELEYIFKNKLAENLESKYLSFGIQLIELDKANFYTNVDALQVGISYIIKAIKQRFENSNKIKVTFSRKSDNEGRKRIIKIIHIDSVSNKALDKNDLFQGDLLEAEKALFGICDWSIISKSPDDSVNKLNILFDINSDKKPTEKTDEFIEGFTHVLTFYS